MAVFLGGSLAAALGAPNCKVEPPVGEPYVELKVAALAIGHCLANKRFPIAADIKKIRRWVRGELAEIWAPEQRLQSIDALQHMLRAEYDMGRAVLGCADALRSAPVDLPASTNSEWLQLTTLQQSVVQWLLQQPFSSSHYQGEILKRAGGQRESRHDRESFTSLVAPAKFLTKIGKRGGYRLHRIPSGTPAELLVGRGWREQARSTEAGT